MSTRKNVDVLTLQVSKDSLPPRSFRLPAHWITLSSVIFWIAILVALGATTYSVRIRWLNLNASPDKVRELEDEVQSLKIALEKGEMQVPASAGKNSSAPAGTDPHASDTASVPNPGAIPLSTKPGFWSGMAEGVSVPPDSFQPPIAADNPRMNWKGKFVEFALDVVYKNPGQGNQQGHIVVLARGIDRVYAHPSSVMNIDSSKAFIDVDRGEFFSVSRFRILKALVGPFESKSDLKEVQVYFFDLNKRLLMSKVYGAQE